MQFIRWMLLLSLLGATAELWADSHHWTCLQILGFELTEMSAPNIRQWRDSLQNSMGQSLQLLEVNGVATLTGMAHSTPRAVAQLTQAALADEIVVVGHQHPALESRTRRYLAQPAFANVARVLLSSVAEGTSLGDTASVIQYSRVGEFALNLNTSTVTLVGGGFNDCLRRTGSGVIRELIDVQGRSEVTLRLPVDQIWLYREDTDGIRSDFTARPQEAQRLMRQYAEGFLTEGSLFGSTFAIQAGISSVPGRHGGTDHTVTFTRRGASNRNETVRIVFEGL